MTYSVKTSTTNFNNMKIQAHNAVSFIRHTKTLGYLSGKYEPEDLKNMAYCVEGEEIYAKLLRIENKAHKLAEDDCNFGVEEEVYDKKAEDFTKKVKELLPRLFRDDQKTFFINGDPRGYSLKGESEYAKQLTGVLGINVYQDFGGYFILAPTF